MYILQDQPEQFQMVMGSKVQAVATLRDEYGGVAHIAVDDRCYVLCINNGPDSAKFWLTPYWFPEAVVALAGVTLPDGTRIGMPEPAPVTEGKD